MRTYIITGAAGHLGGTIVRMLEGKACEVRGLALVGEQVKDHQNVRYFFGDVTKPETLEPLFEETDPAQTILIHTAGLIDIGDKPFELLHRVNVDGTRNVLAMCMSNQIKRMVHVSSVHAIPDDDQSCVLSELNDFSADRVLGNYAKTKAEATQLVLNAAKEGFDAVVVHPSGIIGPYDSAGNHLVQMIRDYITGKLPACVHGGYDMVDVRDVALGCIEAALTGRRGECYILSNRHYEIKDVLRMVRHCAGGRALPTLPMWLAKAFAPIFSFFAKLFGRRPLYTSYSLHALAGNDRFSHDKATMELRYQPRDLKFTIADTVDWLLSHGTPPRRGGGGKRRAKRLRRSRKRALAGA
ncbi:MAG: NAD-dependent epimerase/dehydratase family protein [Clostridia bacterium]